jgi:ceramide glucosyltransferase
MLALSLMHQLSLRHAMPPDVALNAVGSMSFAAYFWRRVRWIRVRKQMTRIATLVEPFTESVLLGLCASWAVKVATKGWIGRGLFLVVHFGVWAGVDWSVMKALSPEGDLRTWEEVGKFWAAWAAREVLALPVWCVAMVGDEVVWRGRRYVVLPNGKAKEVEGDEGGRKGWWRWIMAGGSAGRSGGASSRRGGYEPVRSEE